MGEASELAVHPLRSPCRCGHAAGRIDRRNGQDCVFCLGCGAYQYNAPRVETAAVVLAELRAAGLRLRLGDDGRLMVSPPVLLTPERREAIAAHRDGLAALLRGGPDGGGRPPPKLREQLEKELAVRNHTADDLKRLLLVMADGVDQMPKAPSSYRGWLRVNGGPWQIVAAAATESECWDLTLAVQKLLASARVDRIVLPTDQSP